MATEASLTDRGFWKTYWDNHILEDVPTKVIYQPYIPRLQKKQSFIEIGGFPGYNTGYFYKNVCRDVTLLDFFIDKNIVHKLEASANIPSGSIQCIEHDFLTYQSDKSYDIVFSSGFIEHFEDTHDIISRHARLLSDKGSLLIVLPNFRGLNGLVQHLFDRENLKAHNLKSMHRKYLKQIATELGLKHIEVKYTSMPMLWLEPKPQNKRIRKAVRFCSYLLKVLPIPCRLLSPYIILYGEAR